MATVNFSIPEDVKAAFDKTFAGQNKSAVLTELMRRAVQESQQRKQRLQLFRQLAQGRAQRATMSRTQREAARDAGRP